MADIHLNRGLVAIVDDEDYPALSAHKWRVDTSGRYARRNLSRNRSLYMHRYIMAAPFGMEVDHINGNGLDNRKDNLRIVTHAQNLRNQKKRTTSKSGYKGVCWHQRDRRWRAQIMVDGRQKYLGYFDAPEKAHAAYCAAAKELRGEFARA